MGCHYVHALLHCLSFIVPTFIVKPNKMLITNIIIDYYRLLSINTYYYVVI